MSLIKRLTAAMTSANTTSPNQMLVSAGLPRPEALAVGMLRLRVAALLPEHHRSNTVDRRKRPDPDVFMDGDCFMYDLQLPGGRSVELRCSFRYGVAGGVSVGMPGAPAYRTLELTPQEKSELAAEITAYKRRCALAAQHERESQSQDAALDLLEGLL